MGVLCTLGTLCAPAAVAQQEKPTAARTGVLNLMWGDPVVDPDDPAPVAAVHLAFLVDDDGSRHPLDFSSQLTEEPASLDGGTEPSPSSQRGWPAWVLDLNGRRVAVEVESPEAASLAFAEAGGEGLRVVSIREAEAAEGAEVSAVTNAAPGPMTAAVTGSKPWISILCKFSDVAAEPENLAYFTGMYANVAGGLDHYWRELSYGLIDVLGSTAVNWVTLPQPQTYYVPTPGSGTSADLTAIFNDCTAAVDSIVDFSNGGTGGYEGINLMINASLDCCAWGGGRYTTLDGVTKSWRTTWNPPWAFAKEGVIAHEMGHGFGLPHSNNSDNDGYPYDSPWDVMSAATGYAVYDATYGALGKHTIAYHKDRLGWIAAGELFEPPHDGVFTIDIDHLALASTSNYRMAKIPIPSSSTYYVVEVREQQGNYDGNLPGNAVLVFEVNPFRGEPAWILDADNPPANYSSNAGSMWTTGELWEDVANEISVSVDAPTAEGFRVTLSVGPAAVLAAAPGSLDFGSAELNTPVPQVVTLSNPTAGTAPLQVSAITLSDTLRFSLDHTAGGNPCGGTSPLIAPGGSCTVGVTFNADNEATFNATLEITANGDPASKVLPLTGTGVTCVATAHLVLANVTEMGNPVLEEGCISLTAGPYVVGPTGSVTLSAPEVILKHGFSTDAGAQLTIEN